LHIRSPGQDEQERSKRAHIHIDVVFAVDLPKNMSNSQRVLYGQAFGLQDKIGFIDKSEQSVWNCFEKMLQGAWNCQSKLVFYKERFSRCI